LVAFCFVFAKKMATTVASKVHEFEVSSKWYFDAGNGRVDAGSRMPILYGPPPEFGGQENVWSPEHLLCSSVATCYVTTLLSFAKLLKVEIRNLAITASAEFEKKEICLEATRIILRPRISFRKDPGRGVAEKLIDKAKRYCFISNSLKGEVVVIPEIQFT